MDSLNTAKFLQESQLKNSQLNRTFDKNSYFFYMYTKCNFSNFIKEIEEVENEDELSGKLKKADSENEKNSTSNLSKSKSLSRIGNPSERVEIILKKHELNEKKLKEKKKIQEDEVEKLHLISFYF